MRKGTSVSSDYERLLVRPRRACHLLDCGTTRLYELIGDGELESFLDGGSRKITVELSGATSPSTSPQPRKQAPYRRWHLRTARARQHRASREK